MGDQTGDALAGWNSLLPLETMAAKEAKDHSGLSGKTPRLLEIDRTGIKVCTKWQSSIAFGDEAIRTSMGNRPYGNGG